MFTEYNFLSNMEKTKISKELKHPTSLQVEIIANLIEDGTEIDTLVIGTFAEI